MARVWFIFLKNMLLTKEKKLMISDQNCDLQVSRPQSTPMAIVSGHHPLTPSLPAEMASKNLKV